jgi:hypothetical protein
MLDAVNRAVVVHVDDNGEPSGLVTGGRVGPPAAATRRLCCDTPQNRRDK